MLRNVLLTLSLASGLAMAQTSMMLPENSATRVSDHVYATVGFPNIAYVIGDNATLVVDTGLGAKNGAIVLKEAQKLAKGPKLFLTTTHFHPEHAMGEQAFPASTVIIRPKAQQEELDQRRDEFIRMFSGFGQGKELLQGVKMRTPDIVFDREMTLDLGGVSARLFWLGTAHTRGDELIFVKEDSVLISGDIVQDKIVPNMPNDDTSAKNWIAILDQLEPLKPRFIVPDHGPLGDGSLIAKERAFLVDLQTRSLELKHKGVSADDAAKQLTDYVKQKYPDWTTMGPTASVVKRVYAESQ